MALIQHEIDIGFSCRRYNVLRRLGRQGRTSENRYPLGVMLLYLEVDFFQNPCTDRFDAMIAGLGCFIVQVS